MCDIRPPALDSRGEGWLRLMQHPMKAPEPKDPPMSAAPFRKLAVLFALALALLWPAMATAAKTETAIFSGGCFWCMESDMKAIPGVVSVESGYTGGAMKRPTHQDVLTEKTGHQESVRG